WEISKMLKNKSFLISILLAPIIMGVFSALPALMARVEEDRGLHLYIVDELGIYETLAAHAPALNIVLERHTGDLVALQDQISGKPGSAYLVLDEKVLAERRATIMLGGDGLPTLTALNALLESLLRQLALQREGLPNEAIISALTPFSIDSASLTQAGDSMARVVPAVFSAIILFGVYITGMMILQSAMAEKKDRMAEVILSSVSAESLMQGKLLGYSVLGLLQILSWLVFGAVVAQYRLNIPVFTYLWRPELALSLFFAIAGYFLYASILVAIGSTIDDLATTTNFQSTIMMIPILPLLFIQPVIVNPNGIVATFGSYFPLTAAGVMLLRLGLSTTMT
ncbi:MAG: ABC transporter permease, partial [Thermaerobacter sp.]|nr:ABC transporter permease [Thermaerobacter sp.]